MAGARLSLPCKTSVLVTRLLSDREAFLAALAQEAVTLTLLRLWRWTIRPSEDHVGALTKSCWWPCQAEGRLN